MVLPSAHHRLPDDLQPGRGNYDFRPDFLALCLYGVLICSILWSETFLYASRSWIVAAAAIVLISFRFFTALYVAGILSCLLTILVWSAVKSNSSDDRSLARLRARNLLAASIVIALIAAPLLFGARHELYEYYLLGHVLGEEKYIRAHQLGLYTVLDHVLYYPKSVYKDHLGWLSVALTVFIFAFSVGIFLLLHLPQGSPVTTLEALRSRLDCARHRQLDSDRRSDHRYC